MEKLNPSRHQYYNTDGVVKTTTQGHKMKKKKLKKKIKKLKKRIDWYHRRMIGDLLSTTMGEMVKNR